MDFEIENIVPLIRKNLDILFLTLFGIAMVAIGIREWKTAKPSELLYFQEDTNGDGVYGDVIIDVSGAVVAPGLYRFQTGSRIAQAIEAAGGFTDEVDAQWVSQKLNLAAVITDGDKIYIPSREDALEKDTNPSNISINEASLDALQSLSGIGESRAQKIIDNRPYYNLQDLVDKKIVPQSVIDTNADKLML